MGGASYAYDGVDNRVKQTVGVNITQYLLDLQPGLAVVLAETQGANTTRYVHGPTGIHAQKDSANNWEWMLQDGLGSLRGVVDNTVAVLESRLYEPYGVPFGATGTSQTSYSFTGEPTDSNGLLHLRARYYAPNLGVFPSLDPYEGIPERPMSLNGYSWVEGNAANRVDPSGMIYEDMSKWDQRKTFADMRKYQGGDTCSRIGFLADNPEITRQNVVDLANQVNISASLLAGIVEQEYQNSRVERGALTTLEENIGVETLFTTQIAELVSALITPIRGTGTPSYGIAQIQEQNAVDVVSRNLGAFMPYFSPSYIESDVPGLLRNNPVFSVHVAAYLLRGIRDEILYHLTNEEEGDLPVRITLGEGGCVSENNCAITQQQLDLLTMVGYNQGVVRGEGGIIDLLRQRRSGTIDWYNGIVNTIAIHPYIQEIASREGDIASCFNSFR